MCKGGETENYLPESSAATPSAILWPPPSPSGDGADSQNIILSTKAFHAGDQEREAYSMRGIESEQVSDIRKCKIDKWDVDTIVCANANTQVFVTHVPLVGVVKGEELVLCSDIAQNALLLREI